MAAVEHIGSTAVPGLGGRPILDIMVGLRRLEDADACVGPLGSIAYEYVPEDEAFAPDRRLFKKGPVGRRTHHLHMVEIEGAYWNDRLLFRDFLRTRPEEARRYLEVKLGLGARVGFDKLRHSDTKTEFIQAAVERARKGLP